MRRQRVLVVLTVLLAGFAALQWRLVKLQVLQASVWGAESQRTTMTFEALPFERGWILDRNGEPFARTEEVRDLRFRFRDWRHWKRGAAAGQLGALLWLLDGERRTTRALLDELPADLSDLATLPVSALVAVQPRQRQLDARTFLKGLLGETFAASLTSALSSQPSGAAGAGAGQLPPARGSSSVRSAGSPTLGELPGFVEGRARAEALAAGQRRALGDLADAAGCSLSTLCGAMDAVIAGNDAQVEARLARNPPDEDPFGRSRSMHAEQDNVSALLLQRVSYACQTLVAIRGQQLPGFTVGSNRRRVYPEAAADVAPLLIGTLGAADTRSTEAGDRDRLRLADLASLEDPTDAEMEEFETLRIRVREIDYDVQDDFGRLGLESALEPLLRGKRGWIATTPLADGEEGGRVESVPPQRGLNVTLTLDMAMQRAAESALEHFQAGEMGNDDFGRPSAWPGAIVLLDPQTGGVLALATSPRPTRAQLTESYGTLLSDSHRLGLLCNRCLGPGASGNLPPPGSTFKPLAALAGLTLGVVSADTTFDCERKLSFGETELGCTGLHHDIDVNHALAQSCNIWFYHLAERLGADVLRDTVSTFGLDRPTGLLSGNEVLAAYGITTASGVRESSLAPRAGPLSRLETARLGIGQSALDDVTPLQIAVAFAAVGTGELRPPSLIAAVEGYGALPPRAARPLPYSAAALAIVRDGLASVVDSSRGTAHDVALPADLSRLTIAAKTGTAQVGGKPDHSWIAGYMPRERPRLAFAILLEHTGRHGGDACVPVLNELLASGAVHDELLRVSQP